MPAGPEPLAEGVWRIPTLGRSAINSFAFCNDDGTVALVDAGLRGASKRLAASLSELGRRPSDVTTVLLTHAHSDHAGGAAGLRRRSGAGTALHPDDRPYLEHGRRPPGDTTRPLAKVLSLVAPHQPSCPVDGTFSEGDVLPVAGGLQVLHTPGHSPGHCSFLHPRSGVLITGDALFNFRHRISWSTALFCTDFPLSKKTAERLGEVDYEVAAFTHGPPLTDDPRRAIRQFLLAHRGGG